MTRRLASSAAALVVLVIAGCGGGGNVGDLAEGDCFTAASATELTEVEVVDCAEAHTFEVVGEFPLADADSLPTQNEMDTLAAANCPDGYTDYLRPTEESWADGDRDVDCLQRTG